MDFLLTYAPSVIALVLAVIGVFYSKSGERNRLTTVGYIILGLIVVTGALSVFETHRKAESAAFAAARASDLQNNLDNQRKLIEWTALKDFDLRREAKNGLLVIEVPNSDPEKITGIDGFVGILPTFGRAGVRGKFEIQVSEVINHQATLTSVPGDKVRFDAGGNPPLFLAKASQVCLRVAAGDCDNTIDKPDRWFADPADLSGGIMSYGTSLPGGSPMLMILSRLAGGERYGTVSFQVPNITPGEYEQVTAAAERMHPYFKFYVPMRPDNATEECISVIVVDLAFVPDSASSMSNIIWDLNLGPGGTRPEPCESQP